MKFFFIIILFISFNVSSISYAKSFIIGEEVSDYFNYNKHLKIKLSPGKWHVIRKAAEGVPRQQIVGIGKVENSEIQEVIEVYEGKLAGYYVKYVDPIIIEMVFKNQYDGCYKRAEYYLLELYRKGSTFNCMIVRHEDMTKLLNYPDDPESNSDNDNLTDIVEFQLGLNPLSEDSDGDGIFDHDDNDNQNYDSENKVYQVDSIYGNRNSEFNLQVHELTYYLNNLDSNDNFESAQIYYSNRDYYEEGFIGETLFNGQIKLNFDEVRLNFTEDDLSTEDIDETTLVETRLSPRLRIPLNKNFFQKNLIELEGTNFLFDNSTYQKKMRGLIIRGDSFSDNLYMLLDIQNASIKIKYEFDDYNTQGTLDDLSDDVIEKRERDLTLTLGNTRINSLKNSAFDAAIQNRIETSLNNQPSDKLFVQSSRLHGKIRLFSLEDPEVNEILNNIREEKLLVNQANLIFYVDPETITEEITAQRIYLYNYNNGLPISDYISDVSTSNFGTNSNKSIFGGILELSEDGKPFQYKFNLTNHITNIIKNDSLNYDLGLTITGNIENPFPIKAKTSEEAVDIDYPLSGTLNPLGTVLVGSHPDSTSTNKKAKLELIYSSY